MEPRSTGPLLMALWRCRDMHWDEVLALGFLREYRARFVERHTSVENSTFRFYGGK